jgi:hypothetical protein
VPDSIEIEVAPDGTIRTMYKDDIEKLLGGQIADVKRASRVEHETATINGNIRHGWSVRAEHNPEIAARVLSTVEVFDIIVSKDDDLPLAIFEKRAEALNFERDHFWDLLPKEHDDHGRGTVEEGPIDLDCPCRNSPKQAACAEEGCGFCSAAQGATT